MKSILSIFVAGISIMGFTSAILADHHGHLPKSGTISWFTGWGDVNKHHSDVADVIEHLNSAEIHTDCFIVYQSYPRRFLIINTPNVERDSF